MNNITTLRLYSTCDRDFEYNIYLDALWKSHFGALLPGMVFMILVGEGSHRFGRSRTASENSTCSDLPYLETKTKFLHIFSALLWVCN